jgi:hypothetical protein
METLNGALKITTPGRRVENRKSPGVSIPLRAGPLVPRNNLNRGVSMAVTRNQFMNGLNLQRTPISTFIAFHIYFLFAPTLKMDRVQM